jgi:4-hydroxythreonine-4-phosphate dehydrogenase
MMSSSRCKFSIGITLGDPAGIGPEIVAKSLAKPSIRSLAQFIIIGSYDVYKKYGGEKYPQCRFIDIPLMKKIRTGQVDRNCGAASLAYLKKAVDLVKSKDISALVTAPICKESVSLIDPDFHGHTEYLADAFHVKNVDMMFVGGTSRSVIVTRHVPVKDISAHLSSKKIFETINLTHQALCSLFKLRHPKIAVCGLNPHAGEGGTIGHEELKTILPAIKKARAQNIQAAGPFAADTLFIPMNAEKYDAIIAMYHDQGLTPLKAMYFPKLVNLTIGLPFIRTSPAHGTAFDIAGKNKADETSLCEAIKLACQLS